MKEFRTMIQTVFFGLGAWLGYFLSGCDGLLCPPAACFLQIKHAHLRVFLRQFVDKPEALVQ